MSHYIGRVLEDLWMEVCNIVQEAVTITISKEKKCRKTKQLSEEALQIVEKKREAKGKGEKGKIYPSECRVPKNSKKNKKQKTWLKTQHSEN